MNWKIAFFIGKVIASLLYSFTMYVTFLFQDWNIYQLWIICLAFLVYILVYRYGKDKEGKEWMLLLSVLILLSVLVGISISLPFDWKLFLISMLGGYSFHFLVLPYMDKGRVEN